MKRFTLIAALLVATVGLSNAQVGITQIFTDEDYTNSGADTSGTYYLDAFDGLSLFFSFADSNNVAIYVDYRQGSGAWATYTVSDSTNNTTAAGSSLGKVVRGFTADNIPGGTSYRVRVAGVNSTPSKNGTTSATFNAWVFRRFDR